MISRIGAESGQVVLEERANEPSELGSREPGRRAEPSAQPTSQGRPSSLTGGCRGSERARDPSLEVQDRASGARSAPRRLDAAAVELLSRRIGAASGQVILEERANELSELGSREPGRRAAPQPSRRRSRTIMEARRVRAGIETSRSRRSERRLSALADRLALLLGDERHHANRHAVRVRQVDRSEVDAGIAQAEQEHRIAGETIEPRDDQLGPVATARLERTGEAWPVAMAFAALDLHDLLNELPVAAIKANPPRPCAV